jgi:FKBP-type peptidyl-prolyl cis-trans isomerase FkpA
LKRSAHRLVLGLALGLVTLGCRPSSTARSPEPQEADDSDLEPMLPPLQKEDLVVGEGAEAKEGDTVVVHYVGTLLDGTLFDSSRDRGQPLELKLGDGQVIAGWEIGIQGMKAGGRRKLTIPPHLGYGFSGSPPRIPPDATLLFDVELLQIR